MARMPTLSLTSASRRLRRTKEGPGAIFDITERRHMRFNLYEEHWRFLYESYIGGPEYVYKGFEQVGANARGIFDLNRRNLFQFHRESSSEYRERLLRAHRNNYTKKVVDQMRSFIARKPPERKTDGVPTPIAEFWKNSDGRHRNIDRTMMLVLQWMLVFGVIWIQIDKPDRTFLNFEDELREGVPFMKFHMPFDVLDGGFDDLGEPRWVLTRELVRQDEDPMQGTPVETIFTLWEPNQMRKFVKQNVTREDPRPFVQVGETVFHDLGRVPFRAVRFTESEDPFVTAGMVDDIASVDRDIFNKQSQLDTIILDQVFSQLVIPADAVLMNTPDRAEMNGASVRANREIARERLIEMSTKRAFLFNGNTAHPPRFISPDAEQAGTLREEISGLIDEVYRMAGLSGMVGREVKTQSGVSKAYDFDRMNKIMTFAAQELQNADEWAAEVVLEWMRPEEQPAFQQRKRITNDFVQYPDNFDIMGLLESLDIAFRTDEYNLHSPTASARIRKKLLVKMFPEATEDELEEMVAEIDQVLEREKKMQKDGPLGTAGLLQQSEEELERIANGDSQEPAVGNARRGRNVNLSEVRGQGGGARGPGRGEPTRPTTQQARQAGDST